MNDCYEPVQRSLERLLTSLSCTIHGVTIKNVLLTDFKIDIKDLNDLDGSSCLIECICSDRVRLYYRHNSFQISNITKHLLSTYNKSKLIKRKNMQDDNQKLSSNIIVDGGDSEEEEEEDQLLNKDDNRESRDRTHDNPTIDSGSTKHDKMRAF